MKLLSLHKNETFHQGFLQLTVIGTVMENFSVYAV